MFDKSLLRRLKRIVGAGYVASSRTDAEVYSYDASLAAGVPDAVVLPADTRQTAAVVRAACAAGVPYVPRGFATNLSGGSIPAKGGLVIELSRLNRILEVRPEARLAVVEAGVTNLELQDALAPSGYFYAPDPASQKVATLGGNAGENSGGPHCLKYGVTSNHVLGMTVVLPGGEVIQTGGRALDPPGYDLRGVLIGSEGTLGIVTKLVVRILPLPEKVITLLAVYDQNADAARSVSETIATGILPATLEMMDSTVIQAVEASQPCGYPLDAAAVLIIEVDGPAAGLSSQADEIAEICRRNGCREVRKARDAGERDRLWAGRRGAFGAIARLAPNYLVADCTVPRTRLPEALAEVTAIAEEYRLEHGNVFHAGDGNLHPLLFFDSRDRDQTRRVHEAGRAIMEACVALGGTITGEHGVGVEKSERMRLVFSDDDLDFQRRLKSAFDPDDLLNPGKIFPPPSGTSAPAAPAWKEIPHDAEFVPADAAEACDAVRRAILGQAVLLPLGNGLWGDPGPRGTPSRSVRMSLKDQGGASDAMPPRRRPSPIPLRSTRLCHIVEYDPANQVISVGAGMSLDALQDVLVEHRQWLPLRPPFGGANTLGGVAARNACGPERLRYGAPRDRVLGLKFVSGSGRLISAGGRVVKNVAGYDVTRLLVGSAGALGFITEVTFRLASLPHCCKGLSASGTLEQCQAAGAGLLRSQLEPTLVVAVPAEAASADTRKPAPLAPPAGRGAGGEGSLDGLLRPYGNDRWQLVVAFEGFPETVACQSEGCRKLVGAAGLRLQSSEAYPLRDGPCQERWKALAGHPFVLRVDLPLDHIGDFVSAQNDLLREATLLADLGCGRITAGVRTLAASEWRALGDVAERTGGHAVLERAPSSFRAELMGARGGLPVVAATGRQAAHGTGITGRQAAHGTQGSRWRLICRIKAALDPHDVFFSADLPPEE